MFSKLICEQRMTFHLFKYTHKPFSNLFLLQTWYIFKILIPWHHIFLLLFKMGFSLLFISWKLFVCMKEVGMSRRSSCTVMQTWQSLYLVGSSAGLPRILPQDRWFSAAEADPHGEGSSSIPHECTRHSWATSPPLKRDLSRAFLHHSWESWFDVPRSTRKLRAGTGQS